MAQELVTVFDDGVTRVTHLLQDGVLVCESVEASPDSAAEKQRAAEQAAVQARRDVLQAVVDPKRPTPPAEDVLQAQAFLALAELDGVKAALDIAGELDAVVPVDPKGGVRGVVLPDA